ncbi:hypothetical protein SAMN04515620_12034 [Collimonas sp. OK607]|uniref:GNAT family N-acetyltransferase n=1 Tax=Collimonas sp. OK607 TaxID=1798194 RepID=UPI0008E6D7BA|nr:GNAT family N-acetyltransferase [Collimonas sp. OK607]SFB13817.1 hypothetical protein SAMN04515620_12034 [Collimonas sp. OK607]
MEIRRATPEDYEKIIALQLENTADNLSEEERLQGFIVSAMDTQKVAAINQALGILVAMDGERLAGFLCMAPSDAPPPRHPVVDAMLQTFPEQQFGGKTLQQQRVFVYGPVCVGKAWRGQGIAKKLFVAVKEFTRPSYEVGAAFVDDRNPHSLAVHVEGLKMTALTPFKHEQNRYQLVVFSTAG